MTGNMGKPLLVVFFLAQLICEFFSDFPASRAIGINYGQLGDNLPSPVRSVELIKSIQANSVKIYDANPNILSALSGTGLEVTVMVPNQLIADISTSLSSASLWVRNNLSPFHGRIKLRNVLVGNEFLSTSVATSADWPHLVPAMHNIRRALAAHGFTWTTVGTPLAMDCLCSSYPPSSGAFRPDIAEPIIRPLLQFLRSTRSSFFVDVYPYFVWAGNSHTVSLDYAMFRSNHATYFDPATRLGYTNMLDQQLDAVNAAMLRLGFHNVPLAIAETGWPNAGDPNELGANMYNSATYNRNLARRFGVNGPFGTPMRPNLRIEVFVFALFNEDEKGGSGTERHWGVFYPSGVPVYDLDLSGKRQLLYILPYRPTNFTEKRWCVVDQKRTSGGDRQEELGQALEWACQQRNGTCDALRPGGVCSWPNTLVARSSYAFNSYWQQTRKSGATCNFAGLAFETTIDPSHGSCVYHAIRE